MRSRGEGREGHRRGGSTTNAAYVGFDENRKSIIEEGNHADFMVLSSDSIVTAENIRDLRVEMTIRGGKVVYSRSK